MVDIVIDTGAFDALRQGWSEGSRKALRNSFQAEAFRLKTVTQLRFAQSRWPWPDRAPLTQAEAKHPGSQALAYFAKFVAYRVEDRLPADIEAKIGFSRWVSRIKQPGRRARVLTTVFSGGPHKITRRRQAQIARRLRKRLGEPVRPMTRAGRRRRVQRPARHAWKDLRILIPKAGRSVYWPKRDYVAVVVDAERANSAVNINKLYRLKLGGGKWKGKWWNETGRFEG